MNRILIVLAFILAFAIRLEAQTTDTLEIRGSVGPLHAVLQRPASSAGATQPLAILCHGFMGNCDSWLLKEIAGNLYDGGIATLRFDFNGHGKSGGEFQNMTVPNEIEDLLEVIRWARRQHWVGSISLLGHSQGGVVASMVAGMLGDTGIAGLVLLAPAAVLRDDALRGNTMGAVYDPWNMTDDYVQLPFGGLRLGRRFIETALTLPIYETALNYEGPVFIMHGTHDRVVPYTYGERYNMGYKNSSMRLIPGEDHGFSQNTPDAARCAAEWLITLLSRPETSENASK